MTPNYFTMPVMSALGLGVWLFLAAPSEAAIVTQLDIAGELAGLNVGGWESLFGNGTANGQFQNSTLIIGEPAVANDNTTTKVFPAAWTAPLSEKPVFTPEKLGRSEPVHVKVEPVPLPAAVILFGSGLCGIVGIVVRRQGPLKRQDLGSGSAVPQSELARSSAVLIVSSDHGFASGVEEQLTRSGYQSRTVASVTELLEIVQHRPPALVLVDRRVSDWDVLRTETAMSHVPILTLIPQEVTGKEEDVIADLERGADGVYACRDGHRLFLAVIGAYFRRAAGHDLTCRGMYQVGDIQLDADTHELTITGESIQLSAKQFGILQAFMSAPFRVFTRSELVDLVWGPGFAIGEHTLDVHIHALRQLLNRDSERRCRLIAIKGVGFKLKVLEPSMPAPLRKDECSTASAVQSGRHAGAAHAQIARTTSGAMPPRSRKVSLRRLSRRRPLRPFAGNTFARPEHKALSVE
jgi:DNA-binding response OmpR family regulator